MPTSLRITLLLSASLHMACFGMFEPTFGNPLQKLNLSKVTFLGPIFRITEFSPGADYRASSRKFVIKQPHFFKPPSVASKKEEAFLTFKNEPLKPLAFLRQETKKISFLPAVESDLFLKRKKEPTVVFYPPLPYSFLLYFQDRQIAHIEFMFYISSNGKIVDIKRKVSSGNLDADLLSLRYIAHYLSLAEGKFPREAWQVVNIDLARKNDKD